MRFLCVLIFVSYLAKHFSKMYETLIDQFVEDMNERGTKNFKASKILKNFFS